MDEHMQISWLQLAYVYVGREGMAPPERGREGAGPVVEGR